MKKFFRKNFGRNFFFWSNIFLLQNYFLRKSQDDKIFCRKLFFDENFFFCKITSSETVWMKKIRSKHFVVENVFVKCHFLGNWMKKKFGRIFFFFLSKIFCCKIFSSETVLMKKNLLEKFFWSKMFKVENFFLQNHYL